MNRKEFQRLAGLRLREAKLLLASNAPEGAYYLAGYAVECALKACICKSTRRHDFPELKRVKSSYTHNLKELIVVAGLKSALEEAVRQSEFAPRWETVSLWNEESRYSSPSPPEAAELIEAIENRKHGIFQWLKKHY
jgi:hypothetical protein